MPTSDSVATIGPSFGIWPELAFLSNANFYEYGILILQPNAVAAELAQSGGPPFGNEVYWRFVERSRQISAWVDDGHTLVLLVTSPASWPFVYVENRVQYSEEHSLYKIPVLKDLAFQSATGNRIDSIGSAIAETILKPHLKHLQYQAIITNANAQPILQVRRSSAGASQLVGCLSQFGKGRVICLPPLVGSGGQWVEYLKAIATLPAALSVRTAPLPNWVDSFRTEQEALSYDAIERLNREVRQREVQIAEEQALITKYRELKTLFAGTGEEFKNAVLAALREIGVKCVDGPHPRADLLASNGKRLMAIEAKGLEGTAKEGNFRQVERWKAEVNSAATLAPEERDADPDLKRYAEQLKLLDLPSEITADCKGLMVIGTFRNTPLTDRTLSDFPEPVVRVMGQSDVCGITGLQLFGLVLLVRRDSALKEKIVASLFSTAGLAKRDLGLARIPQAGLASATWAECSKIH